MSDRGKDSLDVPRGSGPPAKGPYDPDRIRERVEMEAMRNAAREDSLDVVEARPDPIEALIELAQGYHASIDFLGTGGSSWHASRDAAASQRELDAAIEAVRAARRPAPAPALVEALRLLERGKTFDARDLLRRTLGHLPSREATRALSDSPTSVETVDRPDHSFEFDEFAQPWQCGRCGVFKSGHPDPSDRPSPPDLYAIGHIDGAHDHNADPVCSICGGHLRFWEQAARPSPVPEAER